MKIKLKKKKFWDPPNLLINPILAGQMAASLAK